MTWKCRTDKEFIQWQFFKVAVFLLENWERFNWDDVCCEDGAWIELAQDFVQCWTLVLVVLTFGFCYQSVISANWNARNNHYSLRPYKCQVRDGVSQIHSSYEFMYVISLGVNLLLIQIQFPPTWQKSTNNCT
jgi:hypothetical protein